MPSGKNGSGNKQKHQELDESEDDKAPKVKVSENFTSLGCTLTKDHFVDSKTTNRLLVPMMKLMNWCQNPKQSKIGEGNKDFSIVVRNQQVVTTTTIQAV